MAARAGELSELGSRDRHEVRRAVRYGRAVDNAELAPAAIAEAERVQQAARNWTRRTPEGWPSLVLACVRGEAWIPLVTALLLTIWIPDPATVAVEIFVLVALALAIVRWVGWAVIVVAVGLVRPNWMQWVLPFVYILGWIEVERRLGERVEERLGARAAAEARACDAFRSGRGWKYNAGFLVVFAGIVGIAALSVRTGWFRAGGVGVAFSLTLLLTSVWHDLVSRRRCRHRPW